MHSASSFSVRFSYAFKIASHQIQLDKRVSDMLLSIAVVIAAIGEVRDLDLQRTLNSLDQAIRSLVDFLIELTIFVREYLHHSFASKSALFNLIHLLTMY